MDKKDTRDIQKWLMKRALDPIKGMVERGEIPAGVAVGVLADQSGTFKGETDTPEYRRFKENSSLIYAGETFFESGYRCDFISAVPEYRFVAPSRGYPHTMFKLYQHLSGKEYSSPEQLRNVMRGALEGKRVLELGSGHGFNLKVLKDLGANVSGVEIRGELVGGVPEADVRHGEAQHLDDIFGDEKFDLIYSKDLFCLHSVLDQEKSGKIVYATGRHTKDGGLGLHQVTYEKLQPILFHFNNWLVARETGRDFEAMERVWDTLSDEKQEDLLYSNRCSLDPQYLLRAGFKVAEYSVESGDLNIVARKQPDKF